jgi:transposase
MGMTTEHLKIPKDIDDELSPKARKYFRKLIDGYERKIAGLNERIEVLEARVLDVIESVKLTPQNSSLPPSTGHPHSKPQPKKRRRIDGTKSKKQGAQPGHPRNVRELIPTVDCDEVIPLRPKQCRRCCQTLLGNDPSPLRHQVTEIPVPRAIVTEYQRHRLRCTCGAMTCADLPAGVPSGQCGPRLAAFCGLLMGHFRQSKRRACSFLGDLLSIPSSPGWMIKIQNLMSDGLAQPYQELRGMLEEQKQLFIDESPTKQGKMKAWLWVAVAPAFTVFGIFGNRSRESLKAFVGDYSGMVINCDRAKMYLDGHCLQWCWAHLKRDIQKLIDSPDNQAKRLGNDLLRQQQLLFEHWNRYKEGKISWRSLKIRVKPVRVALDGLLLRGVYSGNRKLKGVCQELYDCRDWLWTFTQIQGIEPTNNAAERALRPAVIQRKLSFGTQSEAGSRFLERILTVSETCRIQERSAFAYLVQVMEAKFNNQKAPSLLQRVQPQEKLKMAA